MARYEASANEWKLRNPPTDCIQSVKFGPTDNRHLLTASWDTSVRLYDVVTNQMKLQYNHEAPVLDVAFQDSNTCWSGGADRVVKKFDFTTQEETIVGHHAGPIRCVESIPDVNLIATGSWDRYLKLWDARTADSGKMTPVLDHELPDKVYSMSVCGYKLILGTSSRRILIWDLRQMNHIQRESVLKYQIRCVKSFANQKGYVVSSIEGRVAVEYLDPAPEVQAARYAFKCHRNKDPTTGLEIIYPVNSISFHRKFNTFATGGSDGFVSIWDGENKKRLVQFHRYPTSISSLSFSPNGGTLAIASSYSHASEDVYKLRDIPPDSIFIRRVSDHEARNKKEERYPED